MRSFTCQTNPARIVFGPGSLSRIAEEVTGQGGTRALVLSTPDRRADAEGLAARARPARGRGLRRRRRCIPRSR